jgi:transposase InsO family protein
MRQQGLVGVTPKRYRVVTTDSRHGEPVAQNLLNQQFQATQADRTWMSDVTYIATAEGWLYLATVMDLFSRRVVGWSMSARNDQQLVLDALAMAIQHRAPKPGLLHHSDRGSTYCAAQYRQRLADWGMISSMSRRGNCYDNAVIESWHRTLKVECVYRQSYQTRQQARQSIFQYIESFYNTRRRHSALGYLSPVEFERRHHADS